MPGECAGGWRVNGGACAVGDVLFEGSSPFHGHDLHTSADAECRCASFTTRAHEGDLPLVAVPLSRLCGRIRFCTVAACVDVGAASDDQPVQSGEDSVSNRRHPSAVSVAWRREHHSHSAGSFDMSDVHHRKNDGELIDPSATSSELHVAGDADDRRSTHSCDLTEG